MSRQLFLQYSQLETAVLQRPEQFWEKAEFPSTLEELMRFSSLMGFFAFAGYLFSYSLVGRIWNWWPFVQTTMPVTRALMCAGLQWVFFATFPLMSALILERLFRNTRLNAIVAVTAYSMTPLYVAALLVGIPFVGRMAAVLGSTTFLYLLYHGYRVYCGCRILRSFAMTATVFAVFAVIRQMFVYVIGW